MTTPRNGEAPDARGTEGDANNQHGRADNPILSLDAQLWAESEPRAQQCVVVQRRNRLQGDAERTKASRRLNALISELYPPEVRKPSTYGMSPDARRKYAAYLMANGWQAYEVRARIASPEVAA